MNLTIYSYHHIYSDHDDTTSATMTIDQKTPITMMCHYYSVNRDITTTIPIGLPQCIAQH